MGVGSGLVAGSLPNVEVVTDLAKDFEPRD